LEDSFDSLSASKYVVVLRDEQNGDAITPFHFCFYKWFHSWWYS